MRDKFAIREEVWTLLEQARVVRGRTVHDKIPDFYGSKEAAERVFDLELSGRKPGSSRATRTRRKGPCGNRPWKKASCSTWPCPACGTRSALWSWTLRLWPVPRPRVDTISGAFRHGRPVFVEEMRQVDLVISGSVAVNRDGVRVGKGGGYADLEYGLATAAGIVSPDIPVITTIHPMQLLAEDLPRTDHDVPLNYAATPDEVMVMLR